MLQQWQRRLLNSRYHLLLTEPLKNPSDGTGVCEQMAPHRQEISAWAECLINPAANIANVWRSPIFKEVAAVFCLYARSYLCFLRWLNPTCLECIKKAARMNAQMFLCAAASSWQRDLLLEMCWFSVWVQTEFQEHQEKAAVFSVWLQIGCRPSNQDLDQCPGQRGFSGMGWKHRWNCG